MASPKVKRGQVWAVDFEPQTHKQEPGKRNRPALVIQTNLLNDAGHATTIVIPGTSDVEREDCFPLRVALGRLPGQAVDEATDLLIDQIGVLSRNRRKFRQPINVACPAPGRWGRPNSRVTSRHFDHGNASRTSRPDCSGLDEAD